MAAGSTVSLKEQGAKAFLWDFAGKISSRGVVFVVTLVLARLLEPADFGLIAMAMVIIGFAQVFIDVGLGSALIQRRRVLPIHYSSVFFLNIAIGSFLSLLFYFFAPLAGSFFENQQLIPLVQVLSLSFLFSSFGGVQTTRLRKELDYASITKVNVASAILSGALGVVLALNGFGVWSLVAQTLLMRLSYSILITLIPWWFPKIGFSWKALVQLWGFGFRIFLSSLLEVFFTKFDYVIIGKLFPPATLGYFQRAKSLNDVATQYTSGSLVAILFPVLSKVQNDLLRFKKILVESLAVLSLFAFLLVGLLYSSSEEIIVFLFSAKWLPSVFFFQILAVRSFAYPISALLLSVLTSRGNSKAFLQVEVLKKIILMANFGVLWVLGINQYLYSLCLTSIVGVGLNIYFASKEIGLPFWILAKPLFVQAGIVTFAIIPTVLLIPGSGWSPILLILTKSALLSVVYIAINRMFKTKSLYYTAEHLFPLFKMFGTKSV